MTKTVALTSNSESIKYLSLKDKQLAKVFRLVGDISYSFGKDSYVFLVETIIGQMLSNKVATIIAERVRIICGGIITPNAISQLTVDDLRSIGLSMSKAFYIFNLTEYVLNKQIDFDALFDESDYQVIKTITNLKGLGNWSAKMYLIFALNREDILPFEDGAFQQSYTWLYNTKLAKPIDVEKCYKKWHPYCSVASRYLYRILDMGYTKYKDIDKALQDTSTD